MEIRVHARPFALFAIVLSALAGCGKSSSTTATPPPLPTIASFSASPAAIIAGQSSTLTWTTSGATSVTLSGSTATSSPATVTPASTTTYTLTATNSTGSVTATATVTVTPNTFTLNVVNGFGSGTYPAGTVVDVFANLPASGLSFNAWSGNVTALVDPNTWHTTATGAAGATITVTANNTLVVPILAPTIVKVPGTDTGTTTNRMTTPTVPATPITIGYQIPSSHPRGILFEFHGKGGSWLDWFYSGFDREYFTQQALAAGFGVIAVNAAAPGFWDSQTVYPNNLDYQNIQVILAYLEGLGVMSANDKVYATGESDGGQFTAAVSRALNFRASAIEIAPGSEPYFDPGQKLPTAAGLNNTMTPSMWVLAQQDGTSGVVGPPPYPSVIGIGPPNIAQAYCNAVEVLAVTNPVPTCNTNVTVNPYPTSVPSLNFYMNVPSPAYPARFSLVAGLSTATMQAIDTWMLSQGCINAAGYIPINPYQSADYSASPVNFKCGTNELYAQFSASPTNLTQSQANQLQDQFLIAFTEHHFLSEYTDKMLAYLETH